MIPDDEASNFQLFRDCLSAPLIEKSTGEPAKKKKKLRNGRKTAIKPVTNSASDSTNDAEELADFIEYIATEVFGTLPSELRKLTYSSWINNPQLQSHYTLPVDLTTTSSILISLSPAITDSFETYGILPSNRTLLEFLTPILSSYLDTLTTAPPPPSLTKDRATECEICDRSWIPLTYHHLIPKDVHAKVLKRGWHTEDQLNNVAWLCRACHSFVHRVATTEELARDFYTVQRLSERDDVQKFAAWVAKVRWKSR